MEPLPLIACSLDPEGLRVRVAEWRALVGRARRVEDFDAGMRVHIDPADAAEARRLAALESQCCPFFSFEIEADRFTVREPAEAAGAARRLLLG